MSRETIQTIWIRCREGGSTHEVMIRSWLWFQICCLWVIRFFHNGEVNGDTHAVSKMMALQLVVILLVLLFHMELITWCRDYTRFSFHTHFYCHSTSLSSFLSLALSLVLFQFHFFTMRLVHPLGKGPILRTSTSSSSASSSLHNFDLSPKSKRVFQFGNHKLRLLNFGCRCDTSSAGSAAVSSAANSSSPAISSNPAISRKKPRHLEDIEEDIEKVRLCYCYKLFEIICIAQLSLIFLLSFFVFWCIDFVGRL